MKSFIIQLSSLLSSLILIFAQDCILKIPNDPLNQGLFQPWFLSTRNDSLLPCSQTIPSSAVFIEATILDLTTGQFFIYNPLIIDIDTQPALPILTAQMPQNNIVVLHFGSNGNSVTLENTVTNGLNSIEEGNCINGLPNDIFGQFAYCNAINFFNEVNLLISQNRIHVPVLMNSILGDTCPTVRSFAVVDQDQSDNVLTSYILTTSNQIAQDTPQNRNSLSVAVILKNGSDNRLLDMFIDIAIGCTPFEAPDLVDNTIMKPSQALNEIQANMIPISSFVALVPDNDPMVFNQNTTLNLDKINLYRVGVNQPIVTSLNQPMNTINYCNMMETIAIPFYILHINELQNFISPDGTANNLLNFLCNRFVNSWTNLNCINFTGRQSLISVIFDQNGIAIGNNLLNISTNPTQTSTNPITQTSTNPITQTSTNPITQTSTNPITQTSTNPITQTSTNPITQTSTNPITQTSTNPITQTSTNPITQTSTNPITQTSTNPITQTSTNPITQTSTNPITQTSTNPITQTSTNPITQTSTNPITKSLTNPMTKPTTQTSTHFTPNSIFNFCGYFFNNLNCSMPCPNGLDNLCPNGRTCFSAINNICSQNSSNTVSPLTIPTPVGNSVGRLYITTLFTVLYFVIIFVSL